MWIVKLLLFALAWHNSLNQKNQQLFHLGGRTPTHFKVAGIDSLSI